MQNKSKSSLSIPDEDSSIHVKPSVQSGTKSPSRSHISNKSHPRSPVVEKSASLPTEEHQERESVNNKKTEENTMYSSEQMRSQISAEGKELMKSALSSKVTEINGTSPDPSRQTGKSRSSSRISHKPEENRSTAGKHSSTSSDKLQKEESSITHQTKTTKGEMIELPIESRLSTRSDHTTKTIQEKDAEELFQAKSRLSGY